MHNKSHEGAREFECEVCGKEFNYKAVLKRHMFQHSESKPFKCDKCGFRRQDKLIKHLVTCDGTNRENHVSVIWERSHSSVTNVVGDSDIRTN